MTESTELCINITLRLQQVNCSVRVKQYHKYIHGDVKSILNKKISGRYKSELTNV